MLYQVAISGNPEHVVLGAVVVSASEPREAALAGLKRLAPAIAGEKHFAPLEVRVQFFGTYGFSYADLNEGESS